MGPRKDQQQIKRCILASALRLFTEKGFYKTKIQDIAQISGISVGVVYKHFNSKEELAFLLFKEALELFKTALSEATASAECVNDFVVKVVKTVLIFSEKNIRISKYLWLCRHDEFLKDEIVRPMVLRYDTFGRRFVGFINSARKNGSIKNYSADIIWTLIFGSTLSYVRDWLDGISKRPPSQVADFLAKAIWSALQGGDISSERNSGCSRNDEKKASKTS
ncbi:MAG: TetR/AcrR family transcriptional regulator [Deltaproteobacteria bacterium]|nr:TetR/AcrR family transcriptional regulator [Deltaproteobacteria bacterium]MCX7952456.1 TetR/AcrR family transcriptional regulator [Deltaproteobacteria bacterium]